MWDARTGSVLHVLNGHISTVRCVDMDGNVVVSGSRDTNVRVWDLAAENLARHVLRGHAASVRCVALVGRTCVSGSYDNTLRVWDVVSGQCLHVLQGHQNKIYSLQFDGALICSGSLDSTIRVWSAATGGACTPCAAYSLVGLLALRGGILVSDNADQRWACGMSRRGGAWTC